MTKLGWCSSGLTLLVVILLLAVAALGACTKLPGDQADSGETALIVNISRGCDAAGQGLGTATDLRTLGRMGADRVAAIDQLAGSVGDICEATAPPDNPMVAVTFVESATIAFLAVPSNVAAPDSAPALTDAASGPVSPDTIRIVAALAARAFVFWQTYQAGQTVVTHEDALVLWAGSAERFRQAHAAWSAAGES